MTTFCPKLFLLIIILLIGNKGTAQDVKGSIITLEGKKIEGMIKSWDLGTNPGSISFKADDEDFFTTYHPKDIKSFLIQFHDKIECYEGGTFDVELSANDPNNMSDTSSLILEKETAFLQVLYIGPKSLYIYRNTVKDQFYIKQDTTFDLLVYKKFTRWKLVTNEHRKLVYENKKYQGQLLNYLENYEPVQRRILGTLYNIKSISELFDTYYKLKQIPYQSFVPERNSLLKPGFVIGIGLLNIDYNLNLDEIDRVDYLNEVLGMAGLTVEIPLGIKGGSFYGEYIFLGGYSSTFEVEPVISETFRIEKSYSGSFKNKKLTGMFRYRYPGKKLTYIANIGFSSHTIRGDVDQIRKTYLNGKLSNIYKSGFTTKSTAFRISAGVGIRMNRFSLEGRIEPTFDKNQGLMTSLLFNYYFGRPIK